MAKGRYKIYAPLQEFQWSGDIFNFAPNIWIKPSEPDKDFSEHLVKLSSLDEELIKEATHYLSIDWNEEHALSPSETGNLVLLSLWLSTPTKSHIAFRFETEQTASNQGKKSARLLSRFEWVRGEVKEGFSNNDLKLAATYYQTLYHLYRANGRLKDAAVLTFNGCVYHAWQVALVCHAAAFETLLTYPSEEGITKRLAKAYAVITETDKGKRDEAYCLFWGLYNKRSDVVHGRMHEIPEGKRLQVLVRFRTALRAVWHVVLSDERHIEALEGSDESRGEYLKNIISDYEPPKKSDCNSLV